MIRRVTARHRRAANAALSANKTLKPDQIADAAALDRARRAIQAALGVHRAGKSLPPAAAPPRAVWPTKSIGSSLARLEREGLRLSPEADKETLINRVTLTLTGLPPTLAKSMPSWRTRSPTAYEKLVDRLLASPAYGEHMAGRWLDVARYAESDGFLDDYTTACSGRIATG